MRRARAAGLLTAVDCVSENSDRFQRIVRPVLPDVDILFVNDFEAEKITGIALRPRGETIEREAVESAARKLIELGVRAWVIVHFPEAVYALSGDAKGHWQPSVQVPAETIKGTAGAGDALAAGILYGLHEGWPIEETLRLGVATAAASLLDATCSDGVMPAEVCQARAAAQGWREWPLETEKPTNHE